MELKHATKKKKRASSPTVRPPRYPGHPPKSDPFRYGWRDVRRKLPDGNETLDQVPLTLEDILHPEEEDFRVHTDAHNDDCGYLKYVIRPELPPDGIVLSDCRVWWGVADLRAHGPDIAVFFGVRRRQDWATFYVDRERARAILAMEITSPETRAVDLITKVDHYYRAGVPQYLIANAVKETEHERQLELIGYRRGRTAYVRVDPDKNGRFLLDEIGLLVGTEGGRVCCYDAATGEKKGDYEAIVRQLAEAQREARKARTALRQAEARARQLEEELRQLRGEK